MNETDTKNEDREWSNYLSNIDLESDLDFLLLKLEIVFLSLFSILLIIFIVSVNIGNYLIAMISSVILAMCMKWAKNYIGI